MQCCPNTLIYIKTNFLFHLVRNISEAVTQRCSVKKVLLEISQNACVRVSFLIKLAERWLLLIYLFFWYRTLKIFCPWKMIKNIYEINQHWTGNYSMKSSPNKFITLKLCLLFVECCFSWSTIFGQKLLVVTWG